MLTHTGPYVSYFRLLFSNAGFLSRPLFIWSGVVGFSLFAAAGSIRLLCSKRKNNCVLKVTGKVPVVPPEASGSDNGVIEEDSDFKFAMELQTQEALLASLSQVNHASSSIQAKSQTGLDLTSDGFENPSSSYCEICLDSKESWQMFRNDSCRHSFCYECTSKHIVARVQDNPKTINCPGANCRATLDPNICRLMIPKHVRARFDEFLCQSLIPDSQKLFCRFRDCSALLINDSKGPLTEIKCPLCHRSFCVLCRVPWHSDFTCKEFQQLSSRKGKMDEQMFKSLVKKKNWQQCPSCKMHVEKSEGCIHMTCRCSHEFCYKCGSNWTASHHCKKS